MSRPEPEKPILPHPLVAVVGGAVCTPAQAAAAERVGRLLAERGFGVVCGGRGGVMEAACRGARGAGGVTVGILPGGDPREANPYVHIAIPTGMGEARNALVVRSGRAVIAVGGEYGTLSEIALALKLRKPVIGIGSWRLRRPDGRAADLVQVATAAEAVDWVVRRLHA